jgi:hypothetical protein
LISVASRGWTASAKLVAVFLLITVAFAVLPMSAAAEHSDDGVTVPNLIGKVDNNALDQYVRNLGFAGLEHLATPYLTANRSLAGRISTQSPAANTVVSPFMVDLTRILIQTWRFRRLTNGAAVQLTLVRNGAPMQNYVTCTRVACPEKLVVKWQPPRSMPVNQFYDLYVGYVYLDGSGAAGLMNASTSRTIHPDYKVLPRRRPAMFKVPFYVNSDEECYTGRLLLYGTVKVNTYSPLPGREYAIPKTRVVRTVPSPDAYC